MNLRQEAGGQIAGVPMEPHTLIRMEVYSTRIFFLWKLIKTSVWPSQYFGACKKSGVRDWLVRINP